MSIFGLMKNLAVHKNAIKSTIIFIEKTFKKLIFKVFIQLQYLGFHHF